MRGRLSLGGIDISELAGAAGVEIALEDVGSEIVVALRRRNRYCGRRIWLHDIHRRFPPGGQWQSPTVCPRQHIMPT
jgi:hypothetical protein